MTEQRHIFPVASEVFETLMLNNPSVPLHAHTCTHACTVCLHSVEFASLIGMLIRKLTEADDLIKTYVSNIKIYVAVL